jgi:hypothetical protein
MEQIFQGNGALFKDLWIGAPLRYDFGNTYPVVKFTMVGDFSDLDSLKRVFMDEIAKNAVKHDIRVDERNFDGALKSLIPALAKRTNKKIVVLLMSTTRPCERRWATAKKLKNIVKR